MLTAAHIYFKAEFNSTYGNPNQNCDAAPASTTSKGSILLMSQYSWCIRNQNLSNKSI